MYLPAHFEQPDKEVIHRLMREAPMATLVTQAAGALEANHIPMLLDLRGADTILRFHVARANPVWREADASGEVLAIFQGPDTYISPNWYATKAEHGKVVPTWNYAVVHAYGKLAVLDDREWLREFLPALTAVHESRFENPWRIDDAPEDYVEKMLGAIVGMEVTVTRVVAKWKVSQNQPAVNKATLLSGLERAEQPGAQAMARLLAAHLAERGGQ